MKMYSIFHVRKSGKGWLRGEKLFDFHAKTEDEAKLIASNEVRGACALCEYGSTNPLAIYEEEK